MSRPLITVEIQGAVAHVILDRPERRNAVTQAFMQDLIDACEAVGAETAIRAIVIKARGSDFCVGADLEQFSEPDQAGDASLLAQRKMAELGGRLLRAIREIPQPTVCAVQGVATGAGACIAMSCDFRLAERGARMGFGEVRMGMNLMWGALPSVIELVGPARAKQLVMTGALFEAHKLEAWGFVDECCELEVLSERANQWATQYAELPPVAVQMIKRSINRYSTALGESIFHMDADQWLLTTRSNDFNEAVTAFREKRKPQFTGE